MAKLRVLIVFGLFAVLLSACVSKGKYLELESDLVETRQQAEDSDKDLQSLQAKYNSLEANYRDLENKNLQLANRVDNLTGELKKERKVLQEKDQALKELEDTRRKIETGLKEQLAAQVIKLEEVEGKLKVTFVDKILFNSGSVIINPRGQDVLLEFADSFRGNNGQNIVVEGHTDNVSVGSALKNRFPSNWELATARAAAVVRFLHEAAGLEPERLSATGYSYFKPIASNDTEEGRSQNRRIEVILVPIR
ncbi:MAG: OmpA family protein [Deltaproteobacteria bacterium]|nr:MAG: OmpA family protein [Deltaproteobacteria bacterium]